MKKKPEEKKGSTVMKHGKWIALALAACLLLALLAGCDRGAPPETDPSEAPSAGQTATGTRVNLALLAGPTGIGAAKLLADNESGKTANSYNATIASAPDALTGKLVSGEVDIAALPTNVAAALYQKTGGKIQIAALNTLGVLYILENGNTVSSLADLKGKTLYATGQGANPEYVLNYLLKQNSLEPGKDVNVEFKASDELTALMASGKADLAMLPVPAATSVLMKNKSVRAALDLTKEWDQVTADGKLTMGCIVVRTDFAKKNPAAVQAFLKEYAASIDYVKNNVASAAQLVAKFGITGNAQIAAAAIPQCNLICITGDEVRMAIQGYYEVLFAADPSSIGGSIPDDGFYYIA